MPDLIASGDVWLVGAGPGHPDLLTRRASVALVRPVRPIAQGPAAALEPPSAPTTFHWVRRRAMPAQPMTAHGLFDLLKAAAPSHRDAIGRMEMMAKLLDSAFVIPGTRQCVGIDAIIGLVPGIGDVVTTALSSYVIWEAKNLGVSRVPLGRMIANLAIHATIGAIPVVGDLFDAFFRVNQRNMRIVRAQLLRSPAS